ncbi:MAG: hypothetical protein IH606_10775 [Burkholderiales bacterium]|nr:hypothetical protein [Burkholderiales bacterium]
MSAQAPEPVRNIELMLGFDANSLKAVDAIEGTFLKQKDIPSTFSKDIFESSGQIAIDLAGSGEQGATGAGSVVAVTFEVIAEAARSEISVTRATPSGASGEPLPLSEPVPYALILNSRP